MNIIIVGAGEIGTHIAMNLADENHFIVVIEANEVVAGILWNVGPGFGDVGPTNNFAFLK